MDCAGPREMRILIIEDERQLAGHVARALSRNGHSSEVRHDGESGLAAALADPPDLVVLDLNLPAMDGLSVLGQLRKNRCTARVLILTARVEVDQRIKGLRAGADDYLAKPFSMDELIARIEALGRRASKPGPADVLAVADLRISTSFQHQRHRISAGRRLTGFGAAGTCHLWLCVAGPWQGADVYASRKTR